MRLLLFSVCVVALAVAPVRAADDDAKAVLEKAIKARGASTASKATIIRGKGNFNVEGMMADFKLESWAQLPGKDRTIISFSLNGMNFEIINVLSGEKGWRSFMGQVEELPADEVKEQQFSMYRETVTELAPIKQDKAITLNSLGETKIRDKAVVGIQVSKKDLPDINLYFDKATYQLVKSEHQGKHPIAKTEGKLEVYYTDVKELAPGAKVPYKLEMHFNGEKFMDFELTEVQVVDRHDDSLFTKPSVPPSRQ
jgi:hypothetical protein